MVSLRKYRSALREQPIEPGAIQALSLLAAISIDIPYYIEKTGHKLEHLPTTHWLEREAKRKAN
jgi:hypothetical protein